MHDGCLNLASKKGFAPACKEYPPAVHEECASTLIIEVTQTALARYPQFQIGICRAVDTDFQRSMLGSMSFADDVQYM